MVGGTEFNIEYFFFRYIFQWWVAYQYDVTVGVTVIGSINKNPHVTLQMRLFSDWTAVSQTVLFPYFDSGHKTLHTQRVIWGPAMFDVVYA